MRREEAPWEERKRHGCCCMQTNGVNVTQRRGLKRCITLGIKGKTISRCYFCAA